MRVVFAPHAYWPSIGGAERYAQGLAEGLAGLGHEVHVVVADVDDPEAFYELGHGSVGGREETIGGVIVHRLDYGGFAYRHLGRLLGSQRVISSSIKGFQRLLVDRVSTLGPGVVVTLPHLFPNVESLVGIRSVAHWKLVYVPMLHEDDPYWSVERVTDAVARCDGILALTEHERDRLVESYQADPTLTVVVPPGVASAGEATQSDRHRMVLFVGRRTPSKRLDFLYEAMKIVWLEHPDVMLFLAGSPPGVGTDPAIWMVADARVKVIDMPDEIEKDRLLGRAWVVVNPSLTESFGITTLEAWAHGTPVVVVDSPVSRAVVRDGEDGLVADGPDPRDLAVALGRVLGDPDLAASMGAAGRRRAQSEFSWGDSAAVLEGLIERL